MTAFIGWVDSSSVERERVRRAIALFDEKDTRDELGIGTVRDAFANAFFPGTSTIETRLRYCLFVPWIYRELEQRRTSPSDVRRKLRHREIGLIDVLLRNEDDEGTIGRRARKGLKRLPSSVYWATLQRWQICLFPGSQDLLHRRFGALRRGRSLQPDDEGARGSDARPVWHPRLPPAPAGWPDEVSFQLTVEEAEFLRGRIHATCRGSLLDELAQRGQPSDAGFPWLHPDLGILPAQLQRDLDLARRFSLVVHGAALLYNLMLAEAGGRDDAREEHRAALQAWARSDEADDLRRFDRLALWAFADRERAPIPPRTRRFVDDWVAMLHETAPEDVPDHPGARQLVERRERALKGSRSRFQNRRALDDWGGSSGAARLTYRWFTASRFLRDLHEGLGDA